MNKFVAFALLSVVAVTSTNAQLATLPPSSIYDGITLVPGASAPSLSTWLSSSLWNYRTDGTNTFTTPAPTGADAYGNIWTDHGPAISPLISSGGFLQLIFLGSSSSAVNAFGYAYSNDTSAPGAYTLSTYAGPCPPAKLNFGDFVVLPFATGEINLFNLWFCDGTATYGLLGALTNSAGTGASTVAWTQSPLLVPTLPFTLAAGASPIGLPTWIVNVRDGVNDFRFAVQLYSTVSAPTTPVPEPATFGLWGACGLLVLAIYRSRRLTSR